jgi:O-antigen ligase
VLLALAPGEYMVRLLSIFVPGLDPVGSSDMRQQIFWRSVWTAIVNPLNGVGMGNFPLVSLRDLVSHNAYTQVAAEMGMPALAVYLLFLLTPFRGLSVIERENYEQRKRSRFYYLAVGLQASLVGYMISSFFASVAYVWYVYYVVGYAVCLRRIYESEGARQGGKEAAADRARSDEEGAAAGLEQHGGQMLKG